MNKLNLVTVVPHKCLQLQFSSESVFRRQSVKELKLQHATEAEAKVSKVRPRSDYNMLKLAPA